MNYEFCQFKNFGYPGLRRGNQLRIQDLAGGGSALICPKICVILASQYNLGPQKWEVRGPPIGSATGKLGNYSKVLSQMFLFRIFPTTVSTSHVLPTKILPFSKGIKRYGYCKKTEPYHAQLSSSIQLDKLLCYSGRTLHPASRTLLPQTEVTAYKLARLQTQNKGFKTITVMPSYFT